MPRSLPSHAFAQVPVITRINPGAGPSCGTNFTVSFFVPPQFQARSGRLPANSAGHPVVPFLTTSALTRWRAGQAPGADFSGRVHRHCPGTDRLRGQLPRMGDGAQSGESDHFSFGCFLQPPPPTCSRCACRPAAARGLSSAVSISQEKSVLANALSLGSSLTASGQQFDETTFFR